MIRLINQTRKANGVPELPVSKALMNAAQACSNRRYTWHHSPEESKAAADADPPMASVITWPCSLAQPMPPNTPSTTGLIFQAVVDPRCDCIGVGVTQCGGITYSYMFVGIPNSINFYV